MIKKLKRRFIILAMASLTLLLALIVTGMNVMNYEKVVSDADKRVEVLAENTRRFENSGGSGDLPFEDFFGSGNGDIFGNRGSGGPSMTRDEAEESRFFTVSADTSGAVTRINISRISSVDSEEAAEYTVKALKSGKDKGFVDDFRYSVTEDDDSISITFLDCGRVLDSFRDFLKASILMSLIGLLLVFVIICYFAGRIVRPVSESYEKQKRFITDAGHEIKTPLAIIKANIDLMDMELDGSGENSEELRESLGDIGDQVNRLTGLTNDLVYLSRMEEADNTLVMSEVPLSDIVEDTVSSFEPLAKEQGKTISEDIAPLITVKGSTKELEKLFSIVLENAVKYAAPEPSDSEAQSAPEISVTLKKEGKNALFEVRNATDNELSNESLAHVFDRFYRTDSSRSSQTGGHGIGLSVAQAIVNAHGGKISARTTDGRDFIISAALPLA